MDRRGFLKLAALTPLAVSAGEAEASEKGPDTGPAATEFVGMLIDTTRCIGCQACEVACAEENGLPYPDLSDLVLGQDRKPRTELFTPISKLGSAQAPIYVKKACMHCNQPACVAACPVRAMDKTAA